MVWGGGCRIQVPGALGFHFFKKQIITNNKGDMIEDGWQICAEVMEAQEWLNIDFGRDQ